MDRFFGFRCNALVLLMVACFFICYLLSALFVHQRVANAEAEFENTAHLLVSSIEILYEGENLDNAQKIEQRLSRFHQSMNTLELIAVFDEQHKLLFNSMSNRFDENLLLKKVPKNTMQQNIAEHFYIYTPLEISKSAVESQAVYLVVGFNRQHLQIVFYESIFIASLISAVIFFVVFLMAIYLSKSINSLTASLAMARKNMQSNVEQATADLTQTLETIEVQNIELDMARKQAIQTSRVKSEFLANISHEIRTPMNGVIGFTNLLLKSNVDVMQKDYLLIIRKSANQLLSIIEDILDFSKIEAGKMSLEKLPFSFYDCVEDVVTLLSTESKKKQLELIPLIYKDVPELLVGDAIRLKQVLTNLISNAVKFTEKGSILVRVLVDSNCDDYIIIRTTISDTGIGMTDEQINKLFQPFSQVNQQINRHHSGTGLGLVISKKLIEQMGGKISIESKSNEGTRFTFTFKSAKPLPSLVNDFPTISLPEQYVYLYDSHPMALLAMKHLFESLQMKTIGFQNIHKLRGALQTAAINLADDQISDDKTKPLIVIGIANHDKALLKAILKITLIENQGILIIGQLSEQSKTEYSMNASDFKFLNKPLTRCQLRKPLQQIGLISNEVTSPFKTHKPLFPQMKILVVDDNPDNLKLITIMLEDMQIEVIQAYDGLSAIEICNDELFDLIFMDIRMPGIDGIEASNRIHQLALNLKTPIIALTAHAMAGEKELLLSSGLQDYMTKPISDKHLRQLISKWSRSEVGLGEKLEINGESNQSSIDWNNALHIAGGREDVALELLESLVSALPTFKQLLKQVVADDADAMRDLLSKTHKFHGLLCYTGAPHLQSLILNFEQQIKSKLAIENLKKLIPSILIELDNVNQAALDLAPAGNH